MLLSFDLSHYTSHSSVPDSLATEVVDIVNFEKALAAIIIDRPVYEKNYTLLTVFQLKQAYSQIDWDQYFQWLVPQEVYR